MSDFRIYASLGPIESCAHVQVFPKHLDGQLIRICLEGRSPSGGWPA